MSNIQIAKLLGILENEEILITNLFKTKNYVYLFDKNNNCRTISTELICTYEKIKIEYYKSLNTFWLPFPHIANIKQNTCVSLAFSDVAVDVLIVVKLTNVTSYDFDNRNIRMMQNFVVIKHPSENNSMELYDYDEYVLIRFISHLDLSMLNLF